MREYIFNEKQVSENIIDNKIIDESNIVRTIHQIARYNHFVLGANQKDSYDFINRYMKKNCNYYSELDYYKVIDKCISSASRGAWKNIDIIKITHNELKVISALNDIKKEKIAFVLLADAKYNNACGGFKSNRSYLSVSDLFVLSRVTMPVKERLEFLKFLHEFDLVNSDDSEFNKQGKRLNYIFDDEPELILTENNYKELAFTYLNWKSGGFKECKGCGRLIKISKNKQYCKHCSPIYEKINSKIITCVDCGKELEVDAKASKTNRCLECQKNKDRENKRVWARNNRK